MGNFFLMTATNSSNFPLLRASSTVEHNVHYIAGHGKRNYALVRDDGHKPEIYKYLWMLMAEGDPQVFQESLSAFQTWKESSRDFLLYGVFCK